MCKTESMKAEYPRLLVLSNECFSQSSSNGRTLMNFAQGWPRDRIAQFFLLGHPDGQVCARYFQVTDKQALNSFLFKHISDGAIYTKEPTRQDCHTAGGGKKIRREAVTMLLRELVWGAGRWKRFGFSEWVKAWKPQIILLQAGDSGFMCDLAYDLSRQYHAPLVIYNSEGYYFKDFDYFRSSGIAHMLYPLFISIFRSKFKRAIKQAAMSVYICDALKREYDRAFHLPSQVIYTATDIDADVSKSNNGQGGFTVSYLGNMGVGRVESLCEFAEVLHYVSPDAHLDIYGHIPNDAAKQAFETCPAIRYRGFVSYDVVKQVMRESNLLIHVESFEAFYQEDLKFAFSTKITDSLASGTCFLLYAPESFACTKYLLENHAAYVAVDRAQLSEHLKLLIHDENARTRYLINAQQLVRTNHNAQKNTTAFQHVLLEAYLSGKQKEE